METHELYIPVDSRIKDFLVHLDSHSRTILSARYGDGKSFFLHELEQDKDTVNKYQFLKIYPVNYQVEENKDIFELIKRDILLQMITKGMITENTHISKSVAFSFYMQTHYAQLSEDVFRFANEWFNFTDDKLLTSVFSAGKILSKIQKEVSKIQKEQDTEKNIKAFLKKVDKDELLECDAITQLIRENMEKFRKKTGKKVALILEDMDRIDPAHLFRILNIFGSSDISSDMAIM